MKKFFNNIIKNISKVVSSKVMSLKTISPKKLLKLLKPKVLLKLFSLRMLIILGLVAVIIAIIYFGMGGGFGGGEGTGEGTGNSKIVNEDNKDTVMIEADVVSSIISTEETQTEKTDESDEKDEFDGAVEEITVVENDYVYDNERISLEDFMLVISEMQGKVVVEIKDDNASLKAYRSLLEALDEKNINYVEK